MDLDITDFVKVYSFLEDGEPFRDCPQLINIVTGVEAKDYVTAHKALQLGNCILNLMVGIELKKFKFPRKMAVVNMAAVQIKGKSKSYIYTIDPNFLFQRLLSSIILRREDIEVGTEFSHELCTFPPRLFATEELLLAADTKSELAASSMLLTENAHTPDYLESWIFIHKYLCELCFFSVEISAMYSCVRQL